MASLGISESEVFALIATVLGISRDSADWDTQTTADIDRVIRMGRRKFFAASDWQFLQTEWSFVTTAPQTTGTVAIVDGVVTLTGATFPSALVAEYALVTSAGVHEFSVRTNGTTATLVDTSVNLAALTTYTLYRIRYPLPTYFGAFIDPITYENSPNQYLKEMAVFPEWEIRRAGGRLEPKAGRPELFSIVNTVSDTTGIATWYIRVYPLPDAVYVLRSRIAVYPGDAIDAVGEIFPSEYSGLMIQAILSSAETLFNGEAGVHTEEFQRMLPDYVRKDRAQRGVRRLAPRDPRTLPPHYEYLVAEVAWPNES